MKIRAVGSALCVALLIFAVAASPNRAYADDGSGRKWALLGLDAGLGLAAAIAIFNHNESVFEYNKLLTELDNTTNTNFQILKIKEQDVNSKRRTATILGVGAVLAIGYTVADALMFHNFFPEKITLQVKPEETVLAFNLKF